MTLYNILNKYRLSQKSLPVQTIAREFKQVIVVLGNSLSLLNDEVVQTHRFIDMGDEQNLLIIQNASLENEHKNLVGSLLGHPVEELRNL